MFKKHFVLPLILCLLLYPAYNLKAQDIECSDNYSYLVLEDKSGQIIFEKRSDNKIYPASLTKLMTVYLSFEAIKEKKLTLNQILIASDRAEYASTINKTSTLKLKAGDKISVKEAIKGSIIKSFNETTVMLAESIAGSEWKFVRMMNKKAWELEMYHTNFRNASGLYDPGQYTTNYDLARLVMALKNDFPEYYYYFSLKEFEYKGTKFKSHNHFLLKYKGAEGMKTGFTTMSGYNLIAIAKKNNNRVISVLTSCATHEKRDQLTMQLFDRAFEKLHKKDEELKVEFDNNWHKEKEIVEKKLAPSNLKKVKTYILKSDKNNVLEK